MGGPAGNVYDKYGSSNPIERRLVSGFLDRLGELVTRSGAREAHEVGCGEGQISIWLARRGIALRGSDASPEIVAEARRRTAEAGLDVAYKVAPIEQLRAPVDAAELVICCEVLEHVTDPDRALDVLAGLARPWLIASVPREPLWRALNLARGAYVGRLGNTPGHVNHWRRRSFLGLLERRFELVAVRAPVPWTIALCRAS